MGKAEGKGVTLYFDYDLFEKINEAVEQAQMEMWKSYPGATISRHAFLVNIIKDYLEKGKK